MLGWSPCRTGPVGDTNRAPRIPGADSERCAAGILQIARAAAGRRTKRLRFRLRAAAAAASVGLSLTSAAGGAPITKISPKQSASARNSTCAVYQAQLDTHMHARAHTHTCAYERTTDTLAQPR